MNRETLKELGLSEEVINKVMTEHGKSVNELKAKLESASTLESQVADFKKQLEERDAQLNALSEKAKGNEELTTQLEELKKVNEETKTQYESKLTQQQFDFALDKTLSEKVRNTKATKALLNLENIKLDNDKFLGLDEQLKTLRESDAYLFKESSEEKKPDYSTGDHVNKKETESEINPLRKALGLD